MAAADAADQQYIAVFVTCFVSLVYLLLHTAYSKKRGLPSLVRLRDVLFVRISLDVTLKEVSSLSALTGVTVLGLAFWPTLLPRRVALINHAQLILSMHTAHAIGMRALATKRISTKAASSLVLGTIGQLILAVASAGYAPGDMCALFALLANSAGLYVAEIDSKGNLVRPVSHVPFFVAWVALAWGVTSLVPKWPSGAVTPGRRAGGGGGCGTATRSNRETSAWSWSEDCSDL